MNREHEPVMARFADNLSGLRRKSGFGQDEFALLADLHRTQVSVLERALREPRLLTLVKLAAALDVSLDLLCEGIGWQVVAGRTPGGPLIDGRLVGEDVAATREDI